MPKNTKEEFKVALHEIPRNVKGERKNIIYILYKSINIHGGTEED